MFTILEAAVETISFWDKLMNFIQLNFPSLIGWGVATSGVLAGVIYIVKKALPTFMSRLAMNVAKVIVRLFGGDVNQIANGFQELPLVKKIEENSAQWLLDKEVKLIELKSKLNSKKLNQLERTALTYQFDMLLKELQGRMTENTKIALAELDEIVEEKKVI